MSEHRARPAGRPCQGALLALVLLLPALPAAAQQDGLMSPADAQLQRQVRSLDNRMTGSMGADIELRAAQQAFQAQTGRAVLTPQQLQTQRDLDRVGRDLRQRPVGAAGGQQSAVRSAAPLPHSYGDPHGNGGLHGGGDDELADSAPQDSATTVSRLLDRADVALKEQRPVQARSDLSAARGFLDDVDPNAAGSKATYQKLQARMNGLAQRIAASGNG
ncbi:MAG: hypothetical protein U1E17_20895 [Geminicoccaceae bacterium]